MHRCSVLIASDCGCESTLTTAVTRESTSPKPTTIYRRINVDSNAQLSTKSPVLLFEIVDARRRNKKHRGHKTVDYEIWSWDHWCSLQPRVGNCDKRIQRYYYDWKLEECLIFTYSGCDGNRNNFATQLECQRLCLGVDSMNMPDINRPSVCYLQPDTGRCLAYQTQYFFDINAKSCSKFVYGGCGGNGNRFSTMFQCMKTCKGEDVNA
ncbi:kunitz-type serine protease inhibitor bitisilin-3-like [Colias croceus]|uniref:kunitz-type serine protease inhibitor bitisilin-3-like n=1 Tax=Colias crocea TaxID=72248 RepID=UPI001E27C190|nr:kunitz-type serine protease inhibitor bitisilin-3-like [Colias croceus]